MNSNQLDKMLGYKRPARKQQAEERARLIAVLGMAPEQGDRYAATTGELMLWAKEKGLV